MWPFSRKSSAGIESGVTRVEFLELSARLKQLEREHDDLHASYRRLRGSAGGQAHHIKNSNSTSSPSEPVENISRFGRKQLLRQRAREVMRGAASIVHENS